MYFSTSQISASLREKVPDTGYKGHALPYNILSGSSDILPPEYTVGQPPVHPSRLLKPLPVSLPLPVHIPLILPASLIVQLHVGIPLTVDIPLIPLLPE